MPALVYTDPSGQTRRFEIKRKLSSIGRARSCDLTLADPTLLPVHAHVLLDGDKCRIATLEGDAEIVVNGRSRRSKLLKGGDIVKIGQTEMTFDRDAAPRVRTVAGPQPAAAARRPVTVGADTTVEVDPLVEQLLRFSEKLLSGHELPILFKLLLDAVIEITGADKGFLITLRDDKVQIPAARNVERVDLPDDVAQISDSIIARVVKERRPIIIQDVASDSSVGQARSVVDLKLRSVMVVPLVAREVLIGVLYLGNDSLARHFSPKDLTVLTIFAGQASLILHNALLLNDLREDNSALRQQLAREDEGGRIIGSSRPMTALFRTLGRVAPTDISVLVIGETGTGKELVARELHDRSPRRDGPFISVNCGAIPENLLESELFGHVKGSFTGAIGDRTGKFELANGGTLFLDEIGEMPQHLQVKLLRVLQERVIEPVGASRPVSVDIRIVSATNKDLAEEIREKRFREDLYYRLNEITLTLPPLRDRGDDIVLIARHIMQRAVAMYPGQVRGFANESLDALRNYVWPGNVRQLENRIKKAVVMSDSPLVTPADLGFADGVPAAAIRPLADARREFEERYLRDALEAKGWDPEAAAEALGIPADEARRRAEALREE